jgi:hypothetical protein
MRDELLPRGPLPQPPLDDDESRAAPEVSTPSGGSSAAH